MQEIEQAMISQILKRKLPEWAVKDHPVKRGMSAINPIAITERFNEAFGFDGWILESSIEKVHETSGKYKNGNEYTKIMVVAKVKITLPNGSYKETYGGNDNADLGDAYKGAVTDGLTKIASWMGIGSHVWKDDPEGLSAGDGNAGRGIYELILRLITQGSDKQKEYLAKRLSSSVFNKTRLALIDKINSGEVSVSDAIEKLKPKK